MNLLPFRLKKVADGLYIRLSNHFMYTDFGVHFDGKQYNTVHRYVCSGTPGTGFFERESESHSYHEFVRACIRKQKPRHWNLLLDREPSFDREIKRAREVLDASDDQLKKRILDAYVNALTVASEEENIERIMAGVKSKIKRHRHSSYLSSVQSHFKHKVSLLRNDMRSVVLDVKDTCTPEQYEAYGNMVKSFARMAECRRTWYHDDSRRDKYFRVFFDLGVFDFIHCENHIPVLRTTKGVDYYLLPTHVLVARSSTDFDLVPLRDVTIVCQEMAIQETIEVLSSRLGDAASMLRMPGFKQTWYFNHVRPIMSFVASYEKLRSLQ